MRNMIKYNFRCGKICNTIRCENMEFMHGDDVNPIIAIYRLAAANIGLDYDNTNDGTFDSGEILVSTDIADEAISLLTNRDGRESAGMMWMFYAPKAQDTLPERTIVISDKFFKKNDDWHYTPS